jgi:hypothetical protein
MAITTVDVRALDIMAQVVALLNDPEYTDYTPKVMVPYLNIAIEELNEHLEEANVGVSNQVSQNITVYAGEYKILNPPIDIIEIQEVSERNKGTQDAFIPLPRREFPDDFAPTSSLTSWTYQNQTIIFNLRGCNAAKEVRLKYISKPIRRVADENGVVGNSSATTYLSYKTAALLAKFVGENESRASVLNEQADQALERIIGISNKGRQQMMTRHRPFRAGYKMRSW